MVKSFNLLERFPDRWRSLKEIQAICDSDLVPLKDGSDSHTLPHLWKCMDAELNNAFILSHEGLAGADEYACSRWESILGLVAPDDMPLEDRQFTIYTKLFTRPPYSYNNVIKMIEFLIDSKAYDFKRDVNTKTVEIKIAVSSRYKAEAITELLDNIIPANMILNITIVYTTHDHMTIHTHDELSVYTHDEIKVTQMYEEI